MDLYRCRYLTRKWPSLDQAWSALLDPFGSGRVHMTAFISALRVEQVRRDPG